ncbi:A-type potassium channel modulatory protein KCNIP1 isoform X1 [Procambarus clarkii]|uniref:A-type potassium channel modulatory protein KCNIP1 isoform X1 n=1 Tax=Procambarus clarkii TaxID=6728 RepID=UPI001E674D23|nr:Kv channel-interacting protein 1-like isoform X2 [Procambarus clarkii]
MATPPDSPYGDFMMTFETVRPVKHKPVKLEELCKQTKFTRQEIRLMYRGFKQECPEGVVQEDAFKEIYAKFFPHGNSSLYAHHVFKAFDLNSNGQISFRDLLVSLSQLLRGTAYDKLKFAFKLYDVNGDGCITKAELTDIVSSVHELMGRSSHNRHRLQRDLSSFVTVSLSPSALTEHTAAHSSDADDVLEEVSRAGVEDKQTREHVERLFKKLDLNGDGVVTIDEFIQSCMQDEVITESLKVFEGL